MTNEDYQKVNEVLPFRWLLNRKTNQLVFKNHTEAIRYNLGLGFPHTRDSVIKRCLNIISHSALDVKRAMLAQSKKYKQYYKACEETNRISLLSHTKEG